MYKIINILCETIKINKKVISQTPLFKNYKNNKWKNYYLQANTFSINIHLSFNKFANSI